MHCLEASLDVMSLADVLQWIGNAGKTGQVFTHSNVLLKRSGLVYQTMPLQVLACGYKKRAVITALQKSCLLALRSKTRRHSRRLM